MVDSAAWLPLVVLVPVMVFWAYSLLDFSRTPEREIRTFPRDVWLAVMTFGSVLGCAAWWLAGRPHRP